MRKLIGVLMILLFLAAGNLSALEVKNILLADFIINQQEFIPVNKNAAFKLVNQDRTAVLQIEPPSLIELKNGIQYVLFVKITSSIMKINWKIAYFYDSDKITMHSIAADQSAEVRASSLKEIRVLLSWKRRLVGQI